MRTLAIIAAVLVGVLVLAVAGHAVVFLMPADYDSITNAELARMVEAGEDVTVVDVRKEADFRAGHVPGAVNIPSDELRERYGEVPRDARVAVTCYRGLLNRMAARRFAEAGYDVLRVEGGMRDWGGELVQ